MNDDIYERFIKTIGIMFGGYFFLYIMIVTTQKPPRGIALKIVIAFEMIAKGFFYIALVVGASCFLAALIDNHLTKKRIYQEQKERIERERRAELIYLKQEIEKLKHELEEVEDENRKYVVALNEEKDRRIKFENHLKNRTAQAAVNEALGHFL